MRAPSRLIPLALAALLLGCQSLSRTGTGTISDLPHDDPTETSTSLADGT
jgi:hypothetical protein